MASTASASSQTRLAALAQKVASLGRLYASSPRWVCSFVCLSVCLFVCLFDFNMQTCVCRYFPLEQLVRQLEVISCGEGGEPGWVPGTLQVGEVGLEEQQK